MKLYGQPHASREREAVFGARLAEALGCALQDRVVPIETDDRAIARSKLLNWLESVPLLQESRRQDCLQLARRLPERIVVGPGTSAYCCDFVAIVGKDRFYWEFHEEQHQSLKDTRTKLLFGPKTQPHEVPRYFQRLVRDLWRIQVCDNFTIVWHDFFDANRKSYKPRLLRGFHEHSLPDKFSFGRIADG